MRCVIFYEGNEHFDLCMTSFYALATFCGLLAIATFKGLALYKEKQQIRSLCTNLFAPPNCSEDYFYCTDIPNDQIFTKFEKS